jgi:hypothetical protein
MADIEITQAEADALIEMEKRYVDDRDWTFPAAGQRIAVALVSVDNRENFMLDVTRAQIKLTKATYQNRTRQAIVLMRLDLDGPPTEIRTGPRSRAHICISTGKATAISGRVLRPLRDTPTRSIFFPLANPSCNTATLPANPGC